MSHFNLHRAICTLAITLAAASASARGSLLQGVWEGSDHASESIYGRMKIGPINISWGGANPYNPPCQTTYTIAGQEVAPTFPEAPSWVMVDGRSFTIFRLQLAPKPCVGAEQVFQLAIPADDETLAVLVTYGASGRPAGVVSFSRVRSK